METTREPAQIIRTTREGDSLTMLAVDWCNLTEEQIPLAVAQFKEELELATRATKRSRYMIRHYNGTYHPHRGSSSGYWSSLDDAIQNHRRVDLALAADYSFMRIEFFVD